MQSVTLPLSPWAVVLLIGAAVFGIAAALVTSAMIGEVNRRLPNDQQISYTWGHAAKYFKLKQEYRRLCPYGRLATIEVALEILMAVMVVGVAVVDRIGRGH